MKNLILSMVLILLFLFTGCSETDEEAFINTAIDDLEYALNTKDYNYFKECFHPDSNYQVSYTTTQFNAIYSGYTGTVTYKFTDRVIAINGSTAQVDCTANVTDNDATENFMTHFEMKSNGSTWKILKWVEDGVTMFEKKK